MKIIIFGAGENTNNFFESNLFKEYMDVLFIVDNDNSKWSTLIAGYEVLPPEKIKTAAYDKILVTTHFNEIRKQLINDVIKVANNNGLRRTEDRIEDYGEHFYFVMKYGKEW